MSADAEQCGQRGAEYKPEFTHQLFDKERIEGYADGEVTIRVLYSATSLHFLVKINTSDADATRWIINPSERELTFRNSIAGSRYRGLLAGEGGRYVLSRCGEWMQYAQPTVMTKLLFKRTFLDSA